MIFAAPGSSTLLWPPAVGIAAGSGRTSRESRLITWLERSRCSVGASRSSNRLWGSVPAAAAEVINSSAVTAVVGVRGFVVVVFGLVDVGFEKLWDCGPGRVVLWPMTLPVSIVMALLTSTTCHTLGLIFVWTVVVVL